MFAQTIRRRDQGEPRSAPGINLYQGDPVPAKYGQLYSHTEYYACHRYGHFSNQCPDKQPKAVIIVMIRVILMKNGDVIKKTCIVCTLDV